MCGRFALTSDLSQIKKTHNLPWLTLLKGAPRHNIAPSQPVLTISNLKSKEIDVLNWGLIPRWCSDAAKMRPMINARIETVDQKPTFRSSFKNQRCLIPANGYYEWKLQGGTKVPYYFKRNDGNPFMFAGLKSIWQQDNGSEIHSCAIITMPATSKIKQIHDRAPAIINVNHVEEWMNFSYYRVSRLKSLMEPIADRDLDFYEVTQHVNNPKNDDANCSQPIKRMI